MFRPDFQLTHNILKYISQIEASKAVIENAPLIPLYERQFKSEATIRKVHYSTAIEGNYLNLSEVRRIVDGNLKSVEDGEGNSVVSRKRDFYEVINYRDLVKMIEDLADSKNKGHKFILTEDLIKKMHKVLLRNIYDPIGEYRVGTAMSVNFLTGEKVYPYEEMSNVEVKIADLVDWYNSREAKELHPVLKSGILHLEFVRIHPFEEGNGRLARALSTLSLSVDGYDIEHFFCLDEFYDSNAQDYYHYLGQGFTNIGEWLEYFCLGMAIEFNRVRERVQKISKDAHVKEKVGRMFISERQEKIIDWLNSYGFIRNQDFPTLFPDISEDTVLRELKGLIDNGVISKAGKTKSARYEFI